MIQTVSCDCGWTLEWDDTSKRLSVQFTAPGWESHARESLLMLVDNRLFEVAPQRDGGARLVERKVSEGITVEVHDVIEDNERDLATVRARVHVDGAEIAEQR